MRLALSQSRTACVRVDGCACQDACASVKTRVCAGTCRIRVSLSTALASGCDERAKLKLELALLLSTIVATNSWLLKPGTRHIDKPTHCTWAGDTSCRHFLPRRSSSCSSTSVTYAFRLLFLPDVEALAALMARAA